MIAGLFADFLPWIIAAVAALGGLWGWGQSQKAKGRKQAETDARDEDNENAADIRNRVDGADDVMHKFDDAGWRDE